MKTAVVVKENHESGLWLKRAVVFIYNGEPNPAEPLPVPPDVVVEHVQVPAELEGVPDILLRANIAEDGSVTFFQEQDSELVGGS